MNYKATCREKSALQAAMNGHVAVWSSATVRFENGWAYFERDGREVWSCNEAYARLHFDLVPADQGK